MIRAPFARKIIVMIIVLLAGLNIWRWREPVLTGSGTITESGSDISSRTDVLELGPELSYDPPAFRRDLFRLAGNPVLPAARSETPLAKAPFDPRQHLREQIREQFEAIRFLGAIDTGSRQFVLIEHAGRTSVLEVGDDVIAGFKIHSVSSLRMEIVNDQVEMTAAYSFDGGPVVVSGVLE